MGKPIYVPIEVSGRHLHLSAKDMRALFGARVQLQPYKDISQPGQYAAHETVVLHTKKSEIRDVRVVGPLRKATQVEISRTDALRLSIDPPVRKSGDLAGSTGITLIGPKGKLVCAEGVIIAKRHIHCDPEHAERYLLQDGQIVDVRIRGVRDLTLHGVVVRVDPRFAWRMHLDTDEADAAWLRGGDLGEVVIGRKRFYGKESRA